MTTLGIKTLTIAEIRLIQEGKYNRIEPRKGALNCTQIKKVKVAQRDNLEKLVNTVMMEASTSILPVFLLMLLSSFEYCTSYSALEDARIIAEYKLHLRDTDHAQVARKLVHQANWASVGSISTNEKITAYPMVNIISIDDSDLDGTSTGRIHFLLTDLDFTGPDWQHINKVTFLFTDDQNLNCKKRGEDPMEPTCARTMISGKVEKLDTNSVNYKNWLEAFKSRHPAAKNWLKAHNFYLCELQIENIFVLDYYGGPHDVAVKDYYNAKPN